MKKKREVKGGREGQSGGAARTFRGAVEAEGAGGPDAPTMSSQSSKSPTTSAVITVPDIGDVSGILMLPVNPKALFVLAHGAGAGMTHPFMEQMTVQLAAQRVATLRYNFPYVERGRGRPDTPRVATATVRAAVAAGRTKTLSLPCIAGGKSFGGRMTSTAQAESALQGVVGLAFLGFPLHRPGVPGSERAEHLRSIQVPMLFLQGTRDALADLGAITSVVKGLGPNASLHVVEGGDHSFKVPRASGRTHEAVITELAQAIADWVDQL